MIKITLQTPDETPESKEETEEEVEEELVKDSAWNEYQIVEQTYKNVRSQMEEMEGMENFLKEYTNLFDAFYKASTREEELTQENKILKLVIEENSAKLEEVIKIAASDKETIDGLKRDIEKAWKMVDSAHAREENSQEVIENLRQQINRLSSEMEQRARLGLDQVDESGSAKKDRENFLRERERLLHEIVILRERLSNAVTLQEDLEKKLSVVEQKCNDLTQELENQRNEANKELRAKEQLEQEMKVVNTELHSKNTELTEVQNELIETYKNIRKLEINVKDFKGLNDRLQRDVESLTSKQTKLQVEMEEHVETIEKLTREYSAKIHELKAQEEELGKLRSEAAKVGKMREQFIKKLTNSENQRGILEKEREKLKVALVQLEKDVDEAKRQAENDKKICDSLQREREILNKNILKAAGAALEQQKLMKLQDQARKNLEQEIDTFQFETGKQQKTISNLEKERDRYVLETKELSNKVQDTLDEVKLKQVAIFDYKKKLAEADTKLRMQQNLFEAVRSDRNAFSKQLIEAQDEISELRQKLKVMSHQIEQLKEDITTKETQLMREEYALQKSEKEKENLKLELRKMKDELQESRAHIAALNLEERKLQKTIQDADEEREKLKKEMEQIMNERDILGTQLVRRNDELSLLYEKLKILESTLHKGEAQYDQRLEDIRLLKLEIKKLRQEKNMLSRSVVNMTDMRQEIFHLERDLTREKLKCRALEEELRSPLNVHRWRKLEGSDPTSYELIQKNQLLQKRLLAQSQTAIKREAQLQESQRLCQNLRDLLSRQPGPDVAIRLQQTQHALQDRGKKMKVCYSYCSEYQHKKLVRRGGGWIFQLLVNIL
ncbi:hypothetical protein ANN_02147 [Periplaneta americana]|uniref:Cilia- and flagella-associated protein 58 central coiled coil domain-containing protein n=1 Tax=Periplaneta americana TaxID=6978 RepID=A0ABQ8TVG4_PERAM|nr:hypothetical protein ANN_02147 [Periplaneta americana]